jgi:hypothetical protein
VKNGLTPDRNPVIQVIAGSKWLAGLIGQSTGRRFKIKPVVIYPGWFIQPTAEAKKSDVWVLNPKALPAFIAHRPEIMTQEELHMFSKHLDMYIRAVQIKIKRPSNSGRSPPRAPVKGKEEKICIVS